MKRKITSKLNQSGGFTLVEVLMAVLILAMAGGVVAGGMPAAVDAYVKVVDHANAQVLLSTTMTRLRDELSTATEVEVDTDGQRIKYTDSWGNKLVIQNGVDIVDDTGKPINYQGLFQYPDLDEDKVYFPLVSNGTAIDSLYTEIDFGKDENDEYYVSFASDIEEQNYGIITIKNLRVKKKNEVLASAEKFQIRVLAYVP